jgi:hypothetical protein
VRFKIQQNIFNNGIPGKTAGNFVLIKEITVCRVVDNSGISWGKEIE